MAGRCHCLRHDQIYDARLIRDEEAADPGLVGRYREAAFGG